MTTRRALTTIEISVVIAVISVLVSTSTIITAPALSRATFNLSVARFDDLCRQARNLAMESNDPAKNYGVVLRAQDGRLQALLTLGPTASSVHVATDGEGRPRATIDLGPVALWGGASTSSQATLTNGNEVGWLYRSRTGFLATGIALSLTPVAIGISSGELQAAGITGGYVHLAPVVSLRNAKGDRTVAVAIHPTGIPAIGRMGD